MSAGFKTCHIYSVKIYQNMASNMAQGI